MSSYLDLVNKVLQESSSENKDLTLATWGNDEANRRLYPRVKRLVSEAWKILQLSRDEWEFKSKEVSTVIYPRVKVQGGFRLAGTPPIGSTWKGRDSSFEFTLRAIVTTSGSWTAGDFVGQLEFDANFVGNQLTPNEVFDELTPVPDEGEFTYLQQGSYNLQEVDPLLRELRWESFVASKDLLTPVPVTFIPWENWFYQALAFTQGSRTVPVFFSQDFEGNVVFYPQTLDPFNLSFVYDTAPQILSDPEDVPVLLEDEYHDWIAWKALENLALYDKNVNLFNYANRMAEFYRGRVDKELMPIPRWGGNAYEEVD